MLRHVVAAVEIGDGQGEPLEVHLLEGIGQSPFQALHQTDKVVFIGFGEQVAVVTPSTRQVSSYRLAGYFGSLVCPAEPDAENSDGSVLVCSASEVLRFDPSGYLVWRASNLGVDGVVIHGIKEGVIEGVAEHDPPGGWMPFRLDLASGLPV